MWLARITRGTPAAQQSTLSGPTSSWSQRNALLRVDYLETGEARGGGNGVAGHDETSEPWAQTFVNDYPDPGRP